MCSSHFCPGYSAPHQTNNSINFALMRLLVAFLLLLTLSTVNGKLYSIYKEDESKSNWLLGSEDLELATSLTGIFSNVNLPNSSIIALNLDSINIQALKVVSHASEIHFDFEVPQMILKLGNSTHLLQYGNDNKTFDFGGFSRVLFKGKCQKWIVDFSNIFSQENHTVTVGGNVQDNMVSIESKNGLFEAIFLEVSSELHIYGGDANETFEIRDLQSSLDHEGAAKLKIFGGGGHDSTIFFPVTYGAYICALDVNTDSIVVTDFVICGGLDIIRLVAGSISIESSGRLQTDMGDISLLNNEPYSPTFGYIYGQIITNAKLNCDIGSLLIQNSNIYASSGIFIKYSGFVSSTFVRVKFTTLESSIIEITGSTDFGQAVYLESIGINSCSALDITASNSDENNGALYIITPSIVIAGPIELTGYGKQYGIYYNVDYLHGDSVSIIGTIQPGSTGTAVFFPCASCVIDNLIYLYGRSEETAVQMFGMLSITTSSPSPAIVSEGSFRLDNADVVIDAGASSMQFSIFPTYNGLYMGYSTLSLSGVSIIDITTLNAGGSYEVQILDSTVSSTTEVVFRVSESGFGLYGIGLRNPRLIRTFFEVTGANHFYFTGPYYFEAVTLKLWDCTEVSFGIPTFTISNFYSLILFNTHGHFQGTFTSLNNAVLNLFVTGRSNVYILDIAATPDLWISSDFFKFTIESLGVHTGRFLVQSADVVFGTDITIDIIAEPDIDLFIFLTSTFELANVQANIQAGSFPAFTSSGSVFRSSLSRRWVINTSTSSSSMILIGTTIENCGITVTADSLLGLRLQNVLITGSDLDISSMNGAGAYNLDQVTFHVCNFTWGMYY